MEISSLLPQLRIPTGTETLKTVSDLRLGQVIQAVVAGISAEGLIRLEVGGKEVSAQTQLPLRPGQRLTLRVDQAGRQPLLRLVETQHQDTTQTEGLRQALPRMLALAPALERLLQLSGGPQPAPLPAQTQQLLQQLAATLASPEQLMSGRGLRQAVDQSGLFQEARLARGEPPAQDLKTALSRIAAQLRTATAPQAPPAGAPPSGGGAQTAATPLPGQPASAQPPPGLAQPPGAGPGPAGGMPAPAPSGPGPSGAPAAGPPAPPGPSATSPGMPAPTPGTPPTLPGQAPPGSAAPTLPGQAPPGSAASALPGQTALGPLPSAPPASAATPSPGTSLPASPGAAAAPAPPGSGAVQPGPAPTGLVPNPALPSLAATPLVPGAPVSAQAAPPLPAAGLDAPAPPPPQPATAAAGSDAKAQAAQVQADPETARLSQELGRQVEGAIARIQYHQLASLPSGDPNHQVWQLDLPWRDGQELGHWHLEIEKDGRRQGAGGSAAWTVILTLDLEPLGPVHTRISLQGEAVTSTFWAERPETARLIGARLDELRAGLEGVGLEVKGLASHAGAGPQPRPLTAPGPLLDEQA